MEVRYMSYSIVEGVAENEEIEYCPYCGSIKVDFKGDGAIKCNKCERKFYVVEDDEG
jgi:ribosomal protein L37AE/L43A